jgi:4-amino-4-deoxychorismate lyase
MCQLFETIKVRQNILQNIEAHNERVNYSRSFLFQSAEVWNLSKLITVPDLDPQIIYRCRFLYSRTIDQIGFFPYIPRMIRKLIIARADDIDYSFKYANRNALNNLRNIMAPEHDSDILIVKNGYITDTSFSNIIFFDGVKWYTSSTALLNGTKRALYLKNRIIQECSITPADLHMFKKARLINAMLDLEDGNDIAIENIII